MNASEMDIMDINEQSFIERAYGWLSCNVKLLSEGENTTYRIDTASDSYVVRRYRQGHRTLAEIEAELAWLQALADELGLHVPEVMLSLNGQPYVVREVKEGAQVYAAFRFYEGDVIHQPTLDDYYHLGQLMQTLHTSTERIATLASADWSGWKRPQYTDATITGSLEILLGAPFLTIEDKSRCEQLSETLQTHHSTLGKQRFVHADLHFGNIIVTEHGWLCLDFDECGFAPKIFDLGVVRFHARAEGDLIKGWKAFTEGYGETAEEEARLGTALRIFYTAGKIPLRLDIGDLAQAPRDRIRRYLAMSEQELSGVG